MPVRPGRERLSFKINVLETGLQHKNGDIRKRLSDAAFEILSFTWEYYESHGITPNRPYLMYNLSWAHIFGDSVSTGKTSNLMIRCFFILACILIALVGAGGFYCPADATKLNARPLPSERELKDFENSQSSAPDVSRFSRRMDYRDAERARKEQAESARKQAIDRAAQLEKEQVVAGKKAVQAALDANNRGVALGKAGRWTEAIQAHENAVTYDPSNKQYRINLSAARCTFGQARLAARDYDAAAGLFRKALCAASDNGLADKLLSEAMRKQGRDPTSVEERVATGDQLLAANDLESSLIEYQKAMQLESSARTFRKMGDVAYRCQQYSTAMNWYSQALLKDANYAPAHRQMGLVQMQMRDQTGAAASLRKAVILDPKDAMAGQLLVEIWRRQVAANPLLAENHLGMAGALQLTGDFAGAEDEYNKLAALEPNNPGLQAGRASLSRARQHAMCEKHKLAAETLFNQGLRREALAEIGQAVMMEPKNSRYQFLLGECLEANGDLRGAHQAYMTCVLIDPEKNQEAAFRLKEMQRGATLNLAPQLTMQAMPQQAQPMPQATQSMPQAVQSMPQAVQPMPQQAQPMPQATQSMPQTSQPVAQGVPQNMAPQGAPQNTDQGPAPKNMYEGGNGIAPAAVANKTQMGFSTHNESAGAAAPAYVAAQGQGAAPPQSFAQSPPAVKPPVDPFTAAVGAETAAKVNALEANKDYDSAVTLLRDVLSRYLQNPEVHYRLAVDLLAAGNVVEAISEFRIASALCPTNKNFAADLARAMEIHKRSQGAFEESNSGDEPTKVSGKEGAVK
jgi:tetratricopeptide (TPR) repeat protein